MTRSLIPNSTQIPNIILDFWMAELSGAELKVVLYIARRTYGFGKQSDNISINQIANGITKRDGTVLDRGTGLSRSTVKTTCNALVERCILLKTTNLSDTSNEYEENTYQLNLHATLSPQPPDSNEPEDNSEGGNEVGRNSAQVGQKATNGVGRKSAYGGPESFSEVGRKSALQNKEIQKKDLQETAEAKASPPNLTSSPIVEQNAATASEAFSENFKLLQQRGLGEKAAREFAVKPTEYLDSTWKLVQVKCKSEQSRTGMYYTALRDEWLEEQQRASVAAKQETKPHHIVKKANEKPKIDRGEVISTQLIQLHGLVESKAPEAIRDFQRYFEEEKERAFDFCSTEYARRALDIAWKADDKKLKLFARFFLDNECPLPDLREFFANNKAEVEQFVRG